MSAFDDLYSTISEYRNDVQSNLISSISDVENAISAWYNITFPKLGPPKLKTAFDKNTNDLKVPTNIDFSSVDYLQEGLNQAKVTFDTKLQSIKTPRITIEFDSKSDLTSFNQIDEMSNYDPTTKFKEITVSSLTELNTILCNLLSTVQKGYVQTLDYITHSYVTGIAALDNMYSSVLRVNTHNFQLDSSQLALEMSADFDYKVRAGILDAVSKAQGIEANFIKNVAKLYAKILSTLLDRNKKELALWQEEKELLIKFEWDKYVTTTDGFITEFNIIIDNLANKATDNLKAITTNYKMELDMFETNLKSVIANSTLDIDSNKTALSEYEAQLMDLDVKYRTTLQLARASFLADMNIANSTMSSFVSSLQTATPTAISLKTQKG